MDVLDFGPNRVTFLARGRDTDGAYALLEWLLAPPPAAGLQPHIHVTEDEAGYVLDGALDVTIGDRLLQTKPGAFFFIPRGTRHHLHNPGPSPARVLVVLSPAGFEGYLEEMMELTTDSLPDPDAVRALQQKYHIVTDLA